MIDRSQESSEGFKGPSAEEESAEQIVSEIRELLEFFANETDGKEWVEQTISGIRELLELSDDETDKRELAEQIMCEFMEVLEGSADETDEAENPNHDLAFYEKEYDRLQHAIKARASWQAITERLLANDSQKLKLVQAMHGGGQLFGIDTQGKALFKDRGVEPVIYGFDEHDSLLQIYNHDSKQMKQVKKWADYSEIRERVLNDGYELFADDGDYGFSEEMNIEEPFVSSKDGTKWRASWLESGDKPDNASYVRFHPEDGSVRVRASRSGIRREDFGVIRLIRV